MGNTDANEIDADFFVTFIEQYKQHGGFSLDDFNRVTTAAEAGNTYAGLLDRVMGILSVSWAGLKCETMSVAGIRQALSEARSDALPLGA